MGLSGSDSALLDLLFDQGFVCEWYSQDRRLEAAEAKALLRKGQADFLFYRPPTAN
jgi:hypothetical protein